MPLDNPKRNVSRPFPQRVVIESIDSDGGVKGTGAGEEERYQPEELERVQHFGFKSIAPQNTEGVVYNDNGDLVTVGEKDTNTPSDFTHAGGTTIVYDDQGNYLELAGTNIKIKHKSGTEITINTNGTVEIDVASGQEIKLGRGGTHIGVARGSAVEAQADSVAASTVFALHTTQNVADYTSIQADLKALYDRIDAIDSNGDWDSVGIFKTISSSAVAYGTKHSYISTASSIVKAE
jgi:hypothetical protein